MGGSAHKRCVDMCAWELGVAVDAVVFELFCFVLLLHGGLNLCHLVRLRGSTAEGGRLLQLVTRRIDAVPLAAYIILKYTGKVPICLFIAFVICLIEDSPQRSPLSKVCRYGACGVRHVEASPIELWSYEARRIAGLLPPTVLHRNRRAAAM